MKYPASTVKEYLDAIPAERKPQLQQLIRLIKKNAPGVKEIYQYNLPFYPLHNEPLFALASQKHFMAFYITESDIIEKYRLQLGKISVGKKCIRFKTVSDLDLKIVEQLIREAYAQRIKSAAAGK